MDVPERYEQLIAFLDNNLPAPVERQENADGSLQFVGGDPTEVVVLLTETSVVVASFAAVWDTPYTLTPRPRRVGVLKWRRLPESPLLSALSALIKGAREARAAGFRKCGTCGRTTAPEWMHDESLCTSCAELEREHQRVH